MTDEAATEPLETSTTNGSCKDPGTADPGHKVMCVVCTLTGKVPRRILGTVLRDGTLEWRAGCSVGNT